MGTVQQPAKILERSRRGKLHAARQGSVNVLSGAPYGYRYISSREGDGEARYEIVLEEARVVRQAFEWVGRDSVSIHEVCRRLKDQGICSPKGKGTWDRTTVWGCLKNPAYRGHGDLRQDANRPEKAAFAGVPGLFRATATGVFGVRCSRGPRHSDSRLARHVDIIDDDNRLGRNGQELLLAWAAEQHLPGLLDEPGSKSDGAIWQRKLARYVIDHARQNDWPGAGWKGWEDLAERLRPDKMGLQERQVVLKLLTGDRVGVRRRCLELLQMEGVAAEYRNLSSQGRRGEVDRAILIRNLQPLGPL